MTTYAIGDVQGCLSELEALLTQINFNPKTDTLWFTGDLVNRGKQSLEVMRFIKSLGEKHIVVLGNHDLHLVALAYGGVQFKKKDTLEPILSAADKLDLIDWLRYRPLFHYDPVLNFCLSHAGLAPMWDLAKAVELAAEVETVLRSDTPQALLTQMYGDEPSLWNDELAGIARWRCIINYFTRMRYCFSDGRLELNFKGKIADKPQDLIPWFSLPDRVNADTNIIFGHWASLGGVTDTRHVFALDTGCVWGNCLTAMQVPIGLRFSVPCSSMTF